MGGPLGAPRGRRRPRMSESEPALGPGRFVPGATSEDVRREKARARALRQTNWWRRRVSAGRGHSCDRQVGRAALTMDHIVPIIRGGRSVRANLVPCCSECNRKKRALLPWEWETYQQSLPRPEPE